MKNIKYFNATMILTIMVLIISCKSKEQTNEEKEVKVFPVNKELFITGNLLEEIIQKTVNLDGIETLCYIIKTKSQPSEHQMGPWCPDYIEDGKEKAGIWFDDGKVYDVDGHFIAELAEFYLI